jgi:hypothetical protein
MKDIVIKAKRIKAELITFSVCLLVSFLGNIGAVIFYKSPAIEILSSLHYVLIFSLFLYVVLTIIRILIKLFRKSFRRKKK